MDGDLSASTKGTCVSQDVVLIGPIGVGKSTQGRLLSEARRWSLHCRNETGYVWQRGRFADDEAFWSQLLGDRANIKPVKRGSALSFNLNESAELSAFNQAITVTLVRQEWLDDLLSEDMDQ